MDDYPDIPPFLDRRLRPDWVGKNSMDECNPAPPADEQEPPHSAASTSGVGSSVGPGDQKQSPAEQDGADEKVVAENKETDSTVSDIPQRDDGVSSRANANGELASILDAISSAFSTHLSLPPGAADAIALWVVHTHAFQHADVAPRLALLSPVPECGKSTAQDLLAQLVANPRPTSNITAAAIYRRGSTSIPTLLIDEADTFMDGNNGFGGIINSGHTRATAFVSRCSDSQHNYKPVDFPTFFPIAIARIGELSPALESRSIVVRMQRASPEEKLERVTQQHRQQLKDLQARIAQWASSAGAGLGNANPGMPDGFSNRLADNWRPLFAIADLAGPEWSHRARTAARELSPRREASIGERLLGAIKQVFDDLKEPRVPSQTLCQRPELKEATDWSWTQNRLASELKRFGIRPKGIRVGANTLRGYERSQFEKAWKSYVAPHADSHDDP
jgi:Protein of unknown function (DUF3631)